MEMKFNELRDKAYECAKAHGWHGHELSDEHLLMLVVTEIAEAVQADRKENYADVRSFDLGVSMDDRLFEDMFESCIKDTVEDELADVAIRLLDYAGYKEIDLHVIDKAFAEKNGHWALTGDIYDSFKNNLPKCDFSEMTYSLVCLITSPDGPMIMQMLLSLEYFAETMDIDLIWHIRQKMRYNETREYKHGGKKY